MDYEELEVMSDSVTVRKLFNDPMLKLMIIEYPKAVMDIKIDNACEKFEIETDRDIFTSELL